MNCASRILAASLGLTFAAFTASAAKPNILFILTEDQGPHFSYVGTPGVRSPYMDALARSGVYFRNAFVAYPVCSASKAAIYTGLHNHANGILNNTVNYDKPLAQVTEAEKNHPLYRQNRIRDGIPTLIEILHTNGYYQGSMHKLHVAPNDKFPYDEFILHPRGVAASNFMAQAKQAGKPWFLLYNIPNSHRPYPNSDKVKIRVNPAELKLAAFLPDTPVVRQDWAEYLAAIEETDVFVGEALDALKAGGQETNTIVVFMGDHGPAFPHGKMTLYELGLRVPLILRVPWLKGGFRSDALVSELDLMPTLLDLLSLAPTAKSHGLSLKPILEGKPDVKAHQYIFAEISNKGPLPNDGMQERSLSDGRWKLIYRENVEHPWRTVQDDSKFWTTWGNRTYDETVRLKDKFPEHYRILAELDPQTLGGKVPALELYDLQSDPDEMHNLVGDQKHRAVLDRLYAALRQWVRDTDDPAVHPPPTLPRN